MVNSLFNLSSLADGIAYARDASNGLSYEKMISVVGNNHPRLEVIHPTTGQARKEKLSICGTKTGCYNICSRKLRDSDFKPYGTGIVAYFHFLKYLMFMYLVMIILSGPALCFYFSGNWGVIKDFRTLIVSFTLGNIGASNPACNTATYGLTNSTAKSTVFSSQLYLSCPYGTLQNITAFG